MATDVTSRPFAGNWEPNLRAIVRHTPDALVYLNGDTGIPGCAGCGGRVDVQPFITGVNCEPSTNPIATATISLSIPKYRSAGLFRDGNFALKPGLEVHIYYRGYFPASNLLTTSTEGSSANPDAMYPYYLAFHGVVVNSGFSYQSGEYSATLSCADLLHFWQYQRLVAQGSILANRPSGSKVKSSWLGHNFSGMSPYSIMYTLYRDVFGAAGGVETNWLDTNATNASAVSSQTGESIFSLAILYWQKRFSQTVANLRMFGASGKVYNAAQAAFVANLTSEQVKTLAKKYGASEAQQSAKDPNVALLRAARAVGYDPYSVLATGGGSSSETDSLGTSVASLQAYANDLSRFGNLNMLETEYLTKMEIANAVVHETGFEFYQDVDGDIVFKPPFYNMDTSGLRVYRIEPEDVISFDVSDKEPDCTVIKWTGGHTSNLRVGSLEGEFGKRAEFIDYRLVAQFGWRQETFDSAYYNNEHAAYYAAISKMDFYNIAVKSGSVSIPLRPELRPGYPVYIVHLDCFFYCTGISHSFSFGGACTSSLTLVGKRAKFHAPGRPPASGRLPTVSDVQMDNMHLPPLPLTLPAGAVSSGQDTYSTGDPSDPTVRPAFVNAYRKTQGFPNVVMALDPALVNPLQFARSFDLETLETEQGVRNLIKAVIIGGTGVLQRPPDDDSTASEKSKSFDGPWVIQVDNGTWIPLPSVSEIMAVARSLRSASALADATTQAYRGLGGDADAAAITAAIEAQGNAAATRGGAVDEATRVFGTLVSAARSSYERGFPGAGSEAAALELVSDYKSSYAPGKNIPGYYRYYSSAHPDPANQGMLRLELDAAGQPVTRNRYAYRGRATQFSRDGTSLVEGDVTSGIPILLSGGRTEVRATHEIRSFDIAQFEVTVSKGRVVQRGNRVQAFPKKDLSDALRGYFLQEILDADDFGATKEVEDYKPLFEAERNRIAAILRAPDKIPPPADIPEAVAPVSAGGKGSLFAVDVLENGGTSEYVTSGFSPPGTTRKVDFADGTSQNRAHKGIDLRAPSPGIRVLAAAPGRVVRVVTGRLPKGPDEAGSYGNCVYIDHEGGYQTRYAHLSAVTVQTGVTVRAGERIGTSGNSGTVAFHLHFELLLNGKQVDPLAYVLSGNTFAPAPGGTVTPPAPVATPATTPTLTASNFNTAYADALLAVPMPSGSATVDGLPGNDLNAKALSLAAMFADAIAGPASESLTVASSPSVVPNVTSDKYAAAWAEMFPEDSVVLPAVRDADNRVVRNDGKRTYTAPVFPVSDARGYEVVGTYPYGRGISLTDSTFGQLLGPTGELPNWDAVDAFIKRVTSGGGTTAEIAKAIGESKLDATTKAELAAQMDPSLLKDSAIAAVLEGVLPGKTGAGANTPASSAQGIGVYSPVNVAYGLSDMAVGDTGTCNCFSHQADIQLLRDPTGGSVIVLEGTEAAFADYIQEVAEFKAGPWAVAQENYRGNVVAVGAPTGVVAAYDRATNDAAARVNSARAGLDQAVEELNRTNNARRNT